LPRIHKLFSVLLSLWLAFSVVPVQAQLEPDHEAGPAPTATATVQQPGTDQEEAPPAPTEQPYRTLLKGTVTYVVPRGTPIKLKLSSVPATRTGMRLEERDINGNPPPAQLGDVITAKTTEDLYVDDSKVIPEGTVFHGTVTRLIPPKRQSRPGSLVISFDSFTEPDGRKFAFRAEANNTRASTARTKAKGVGIVASYAAGGAIVGALVAYQLFGLEQTIALHGYNIAGGAAIGAVAATTYALMKRGPHAVLEPGDDLNMSIDSDMLLPAAVEPTVKAPPPSTPGLEIEILKSKLVKDGLDGHVLALDAAITNNTDYRLKSIDLFLEDDNGRRFPVCAGPEDDCELIFDVNPHSIRRIHFNFQVDYPKLKRKLVWLEHRSQKELITMKLP
jgi:hypothetical protein